MANEFLEYASELLANEDNTGLAEDAAVDSIATQENQDSAEVAADEAETNTEVIVPEATAETPAEVIPEVVAEQTPPQFDWKSFEEQSEGLVKDEETFKSVVSRAKQYEELEKAKNELEKNQFKAANPYVETLNKMLLDGATTDQVNAFVNLNSKGDLSQLKPLDAKIAKMVLIDGYTEAIAKKIVDRDFPLDDFEEGSEERSIMEEELRVSSKQDTEALNAYKKEISTIVNPEKEANEQARLANIAQEEQYQKALITEVPKIANTFPKKFDFEVEADGDKLPFSINIDGKYPIEEAVKGYFEETKAPFTQESVKDAFQYVYADYVANNLPEILKENANRITSHLTEKFSNKYENRTGLPQREAVIASNSEEMDDKHFEFLQKVAGGSK